MEIKWPKRLFITGIDTDAGKSYATGWLARLIADTGHSVITQKLVQTGNREFSEDIERHRNIMGIPPTEDDLAHVTAPVIFTYPCSPELAARIDGREIDFDLIDRSSDELSKRYDHLLIEGAGGIMVPLTKNYLTIDYVNDRSLPAVLVTNSTLGSINHTLLALTALREAGIKVFAVIYNTYFDSDEIIAADTRNYIKNWLESGFPYTVHYLEMPEISSPH